MAVATIYANYQGQLGWGPGFACESHDDWPQNLRQLLANGRTMLYGAPEDLLVWLSKQNDKQLVAERGDVCNVYVLIKGKTGSQEYASALSTAIKGGTAKKIAKDTVVYCGKAAIKALRNSSDAAAKPYEPGLLSSGKRMAQKLTREKIGYIFRSGEARHRYLNFNVTPVPIGLPELASVISANTP